MTKFFFVVIKERDALAFEFLLKTGAREREMSHLEWTDLNLGPTPTVKFQTKEGFRTKTGKARVDAFGAWTWHQNCRNGG